MFWNKNKLPKEQQQALDYLDGVSEGLISAVKPDNLSYSEEDGVTGDGDFKFSFRDNGNNLQMFIMADYKSPIGDITVCVGAPLPVRKDNFEGHFIKKDALDKLLLELDELNEGLLREMIKDKADKPRLAKGGKPVSFCVELFREGPHYCFVIDANKGTFFYNKIALGGNGEFTLCSEELEIGGMTITIEDDTAIMLGYGKISNEEAAAIAEERLKQEMAEGVLKYLPDDLKVKEATLNNGVEKLMAEDGDFGKFCLERRMGGGISCSYEIEGDFSDRKEQVKAYDCGLWVDEGITLLNGNHLLITRLGRELAGKHDYGLLKS